MDLIERLAAAVGTPAPDLRLALAYHGWLIAPVVLAYAPGTVTVLNVLPRQRRREELSGQERRVR